MTTGRGGDDPNFLDADAIFQGLTRWVRPAGPLRCMELRKTVDSTNRLAMEDGREGLLLVAGEQTAGRGRHGTSWSSPPGGVYMSYVPLARSVPGRPTDLSPLAALAVADTVEALMARAGLTEPKALLKWPNDVLVGDGKVAGILVQSGTGPPAVIGIGLNVNTGVQLDEPASEEEWSVGPRSLRDITGSPMPLVPVLVELVGHLIERVETGLGPDAIGEYRARCHTLGRRVTFTDGSERLEGTAVDISPDGGGLLVRIEGGELRQVTSGEVRHVRSVEG
jgi:BirA family biotin operon repressor/biotin-[acetyl-CoA-carboxylase] ligase